ncbi:putative tRNA sulfurtransferase [Anaerocolumna cellulosilytica]|uniref:Probable tRNA sulfurtransferase n=1 Tax=Anaerocolumna cellulosilytica TaxID=433286 RepID=A0A6S6QWE6_9FIRM|nr:tRNA uracil 4-sulfurtransferase ThiI [Anaerocolumna cellulosilytica]MBB5193840.1 thiamine biosynthesis protein ThiI [Anaerocolumna cellulosilytica]BCJ94944.1 putative tRNA sulfurtransferase [Anaerocolumna cellulosilytica]
MYKAFLIKYAEIGIKGKNRYLFENALRDQIKNSLKDLGDYLVSKEQGRIYIECPDDYDYDETVEALQRVFGIAQICPVSIIDTIDWDPLTEAVGNYVEERYPDKNFTFKMEAKRSDKKYPLTSPEICVEMGAYLLRRFPEMKVDVHNPSVRIMVEVRTRSYVYSEIIPGLGGMPVGSNGKAMLLLSGGIDSPVAGYMVAKRGVTIDAVYFHAPPYTSDRAKEKVVDLARLVSKYTGPIKLHVINFTDIQLYIYEKCPHDELTIIMRRYMMKIAETLAVDSGCLGLITGESIGQVASQTLHSLAATNEVCSLPVYRPLIAFDKQDIVDIAEKINTYETSILPYEDCCTIFVAKHPVTKPSLKVIRYSEKALEEKIEELVKTALDTKETILVQ